MLVYFVFEVSCIVSRMSTFGGAAGSLRHHWSRLAWPVLFAVVVLAATSGRLEVPTTVGDINAIGTFLPLPPHYVLNASDEQRNGTAGVDDDAPLVEVDAVKSFYIAVIFGIMHGNLMLLALLPLPVCFALQEIVVACCP